MDSGALIDWADKAARPRPGVLVDDSFGADWHAYKVGGGSSYWRVPSRGMMFG